MKIRFIVVGKTEAGYLREAVSVYENRLKYYIPFETVYIPDVKNSGKLSEAQLKSKEGKNILAQLNSGDELVLLDEKGGAFSSSEFSLLISKKINAGTKSIVFVAGGAYGFSDEVYAKASSLISLSRMTFTHQMVRLIFIEQLYRAFTIMKGEAYHHE
ncbi:MAG: 23S rRNA (pseudouridine(1915)-N(3))-methyltransferase RlmH [Prevotellaceae bacterium]|jgi:23S rRNA (pseudouridine1915-N3)-methyltransferase|nr:23S rRNA (pseudouridine(1915)-N(3))-methyltransferase RlmH [Prevotellaceae bacterium]